MSTEKLGQFLKEVSNWKWDKFVEAEHDKTYTSNQAMIFALIRACALQKMEAIKMSLNRLDGKLKTPIKIEYPKIYYLFPNAVLADTSVSNDSGELKVPETDGTVMSGELLAPPKVEPLDKDIPSMSLRETLAKMSDYPRELPEAVVKLAQETERAVNNNAPMPDEIPLVKSVVAAHLLMMAQSRNIDALSEVFDQIDGKLAETLQIIGEDIYITNYGTIAPSDASFNKDGVLQIEATKAQDLWATKLKGALS